MSNKSMKAVIQAELDPRGVVRGVAAANKELDKLNRTSMSIASSARLTATMGAINTSWTVVSGAVQQIDRRMQDISEMAGRFSPEAMSAKAMTKSVEIQRDMEMSKWLGLDVAAAERIKQKSMMDEASRAKDMVGGLAAWQSLKTDINDIWNKVLEIPATVFANLDDPFKTREDDVSRWWTGTSGAELAALPIGNRVEDRARAAQEQQEQTKYLREIAKAVGQ